MTGVAARLAARAAGHDRYAQALLRWAPRTRRHALRAARHNATATALEAAAWVLGWRRPAPGGLEAPAAGVLAGAAVVQCATGHEWPASVRACVDSPRGPVWVDVCGECATALLDAGLMYGGRATGEGQ